MKKMAGPDYRSASGHTARTVRVLRSLLNDTSSVRGAVATSPAGNDAFAPIE